MSGIITSFTVIWVVVAIGFACGRTGILGDEGRRVLGRLVFSVFLPSLLFSTLVTTELHDLLSMSLLVQVMSAAVVFVSYVVIVRLWWKPAVPETIVGGLASSYVNVNNMGLPIALYILGDASLVVPMIVFQVAVFAPICLAILDASTGAHTSVGAQVRQTVANPVLVATALGVAVSLSGWDVPVAVSEPFALLGGAAVPCALLGFGLSLASMSMRRGARGRHDTVLASTMKLVVHPLVAFLLATFVFRLDDHEVFVAVVFAALPTAQNVFVYATRYERGRTIATNTTFITTIAALPLVFVLSLLLRA